MRRLAIDLIREQISRCESEGVEVLCCPEGVLGGLADYAAQPGTFAINVDRGQLTTVLAPLASKTVTTIRGFTEIGTLGAALQLRGGVYTGDRSSVSIAICIRQSTGRSMHRVTRCRCSKSAS